MAYRGHVKRGFTVWWGIPQSCKENFSSLQGNFVFEPSSETLIIQDILSSGGEIHDTASDQRV